VRGSPQGEQRCSELSFEHDGDDAALSRALLSDAGSALQTRWRGGERVPLAPSLELAPLAFLDTRAECDTEDPERVIVLDRRARSLRVA
jgi:hypothetical protein